LTEGDPLFVDKFRDHPSGRFVIGADVLETILDPRWGIPPAEVIDRLVRMPEADILVASRVRNGEEVSALSVTEKLIEAGTVKRDDVVRLSGIVTEIDGPTEEYSSTAIRAQEAA